MRDRIVGLLEKADFALASCDGVVTDDDLEPIAVSVESVRLRISYPADLIVAALAGGTGSGKSSLFNAIAGVDIAAVGGVRPTTGEPLAGVNQKRAASVDGYLTEIGVRRREVVDFPDWLCLIDLPDTDSVEVDHRLTVEKLLPRLDVVVWVVDPEKYRDAAFHDRYVTPLADYESQFVFVLNQADRLPRDDLQEVSADFASALSEDGIDEATIVICSADPPAGPPLGVADLVGTLARFVGERPGVYDKLLVDLEQTAITLLERTGGAPVDYDVDAPGVAEAVVDAVVAEDLDLAEELVTSFLVGVVAATGGPTARSVEETIAEVPGHLRQMVKEASSTSEKPRWWWRRSRRAAVEERRRDLVEEQLASVVFKPVQSVLRTRAEANAALTDLAIAVAATRHD